MRCFTTTRHAPIFPGCGDDGWVVIECKPVSDERGRWIWQRAAQHSQPFAEPGQAAHYARGLAERPDAIYRPDVENGTRLNPGEVAHAEAAETA